MQRRLSPRPSRLLRGDRSTPGASPARADPDPRGGACLPRNRLHSRICVRIMAAISPAHMPAMFLMPLGRSADLVKPADDELLAATAVSKRFGGVRAVDEVSFS